MKPNFITYSLFIADGPIERLVIKSPHKEDSSLLSRHDKEIEY